MHVYRQEKSSGGPAPPRQHSHLQCLLHAPDLQRVAPTQEPRLRWQQLQHPALNMQRVPVNTK